MTIEKRTLNFLQDRRELIIVDIGIYIQYYIIYIDNKEEIDRECQ